MTESTLRSLDSDLRRVEGGGDAERRRDIIGGEIERGGVMIGEDKVPAHSVESDEKDPPLFLGSHGATLSDDEASALSNSMVAVMGLGDDDCADIIDKGAKMLKIWSSACGGP